MSLKIAFDIGGVLSKYPDFFRPLCRLLHFNGVEVYVMTDMHDRAKTLDVLARNGFDFVRPERVLNSDYARHGDMCKPVLLREHGIDMLVDDHPGYLGWDSSLGTAPIRLMAQPDPFRPYWADSWKTDPADGDFGRRVYSPVSEGAEPKRTPPHDEPATAAGNLDADPPAENLDADPPPAGEPCPHCDGTGLRFEGGLVDFDCRECDGTGRQDTTRETSTEE